MTRTGDVITEGTDPVTDSSIPPQGYGMVNAACVAQHEWYRGLRDSGFTRCEALYIVTRPSVEMARLEWGAGREDGGQPQ